MKPLIIIKYGELNTKKANIGLFLKTLQKNIMNALKENEKEIVFDKGRMYIYTDEDNLNIILEKLKKIFGIHEFAVGYELKDNNIETIKNSLISLIKDKDFQTFKIDASRSDKNYHLTSPELNHLLGGVVLDKKKCKVDVRNPEVCIHVEVRKTNAYIYFETIKGIGGYPVGTLGKGMLMLSGGIDSPVSGYLAMKRGVKIEAIYFDSPPHTSIEAKNKVIELANILSSYQNEIKIHVIPFTKIQEEIFKMVPNEYMITIMRRMMYRIASKVAHQNRCKIIINGESIGQVASQTLDSMSVINEVIKMPVIRPVACFDKLEIIDIAKKIKTYETSILPYQDCCTIFVPKHPVIYPKLKECLEYEANFDYETLILEAIKNKEVIKIGAKKEDEFKDYL